MLPAFGNEWFGALRGEQRNGWAIAAERDNTADSGDGDAADLSGNAGIGGGNEEELVVLSAVEGLSEGCSGVDGKQGGVDFGGNVRLLANVGEVGGKAVADVDGGGGCAVTDEPKALRDSGLWVKVGS
jgi:hypothetical protein